MNTDRFKAKALTVEDNPKWVEGYVYQGSDGENTRIFAPGGSYAVNPDTLCQCTGLKDKEGNLIYEGDILDHEGFGVWQVHWNRSEWTMRLHGGRMNVAANLQDAVYMTLTGKNIHDPK